jgi:hypothetical protein
MFMDLNGEEDACSLSILFHSFPPVGVLRAKGNCLSSWCHMETKGLYVSTPAQETQCCMDAIHQTPEGQAHTVVSQVTWLPEISWAH